MAEQTVLAPAQMAFDVQAKNALAGGRMPPKTYTTADVARARRVSEEFEAVFLSELFKPMFEGIKVEEPFGGGYAEEIWRSLQIAEYGKAMARAGGIGIGDAVFRQILRMQEVK